jgi:hypothetical protein
MPYEGDAVSRWHFVTTCVSAKGEDIDEMNRAARDVTYRTMLNRVGEAFIEMQGVIGYDINGKRETGLRMKNDWHVSYHRSTYQGKPCFFFRWSHIEHIFQEA